MCDAALVAWSGRVFGTEGNRDLLESKWWSAPAAGVPHCQNDQLVVERRVVDVVTTARQEDPSRATDRRSSVGMSNVGRRSDQVYPLRRSSSMIAAAGRSLPAARTSTISRAPRAVADAQVEVSYKEIAVSATDSPNELRVVTGWCLAVQTKADLKVRLYAQTKGGLKDRPLHP